MLAFDSRLHNCGWSTTVCTCRKDLNFSHRPDGRLTFCSLFAGWWCLRLFRNGHDNVFLDLREFSYSCACSCSKIPIASMGKLLTCLPGLSLAQLRPTLRSTTEGTCSRDPKLPIAPMGDSSFARFLQGGGVNVFSGTVTISSCTISGNTASYVCAHVQNFPSPPWEFLLTCPNRLSSLNSDQSLVLSGICTC